jgi:hypothetical protein
MIQARYRALLITVALLASGQAAAQLTDMVQAPNPEGVGIAKSLADQIGAGVGDWSTPNSSSFIVARDPARAVRRGRQLFQLKFSQPQGLGPRANHGVGDIANNLAIGAGISDSCAGCHGRPRGAAGFGGDVVTRPDSRDAPHLFGLGLKEMLADEMTTELRGIRDRARQDASRTGRAATRPLTAKGINFGYITVSPTGVVDNASIRGVDPDLRVKPFFAHGGTATIREFVVGAFNDEMGLQAVDPLLTRAAGGAQVTTPTGMRINGATDTVSAPRARFAMDDPDGDGVRNEIPAALVDYMEFYLFNYFKPGRDRQTQLARVGFDLMRATGCTSCHVQNLTINQDRRVADVETQHDATRGIFNNLFSTASLQITARDDGSGFPALKIPNNRAFQVANIYTDFKRHDIGPKFYERNYDGTLRKEFLTTPLWGVGSTAPYGHDGRSINLREVILRHGGEALLSRNAFANLPEYAKLAVTEYLNTLVLFPPDDTASNLDPGNPANPDFPQRGHGSIKLTVLFNNPLDPE